jgi:hypothetical protein
MARRIDNILLKGLLGIFLLILIGVSANFFAGIVENESLLLVLNMIGDNLILLLVISIFFLVAELLFALRFPFSLPAPVFNAVGSVLVVSFIFNLFYLVDDLVGRVIFGFLTPVSWLVYFLVFVIVLIVGFIRVFSDIGRVRRRRRRRVYDENDEDYDDYDVEDDEDFDEDDEYSEYDEDGEYENISKSRRAKSRDEVSWDDVGNEFRGAMASFARAVRNAFEPQRRPEKKKKKSFSKKKNDKKSKKKS